MRFKPLEAWGSLGQKGFYALAELGCAETLAELVNLYPEAILLGIEASVHGPDSRPHGVRRAGGDACDDRLRFVE